MSTLKKRTGIATSTQPSKRKHIQPSHTIHISNLNSKINKKKLIENLYILLSSFADVIQIKYSPKHRGQVWAVIASDIDAKACIDQFDGFQFFDKKIELSYAQNESKLIDKLLSSTST